MLEHSDTKKHKRQSQPNNFDKSEKRNTYFENTGNCFYVDKIVIFEKEDTGFIINQEFKINFDFTMNSLEMIASGGACLPCCKWIHQ